VPEVNWNVFEALSGATTDNFEGLCRALIKQHYGQFGRFAALANQPGVEFHLKLDKPCSLSEADRWWGWQCRWYEIRRGSAIGKTRRNKIEKAIETTEKHLPNLTDWVLWTHHPLTKRDQDWFYALPTTMKLHLWTAKDIEELLSGPATIFRTTYFGELILSPDDLRKLHQKAVAPIQHRWMTDVHQIVDAERDLNFFIGNPASWKALQEIAMRLKTTAKSVEYDTNNLPDSLTKPTNVIVAIADSLADSLIDNYNALYAGDFEAFHSQFSMPRAKPDNWQEFLRRLHRGHHQIVLPMTNLVADIYAADDELRALQEHLETGLVAVVADAGCGKTQLAAQLTQAKDNDTPAGVLLHGNSLSVNDTLDSLAANSIILHGKPVPSFEALVAAVDAAGRRANCRLPIVIDGLNESEDPRNWKRLLAPLHLLMADYPYVLVVCTLRPAFKEEALPDNTSWLEIPDFEHHTVEAIRRYFRYYRIDPVDAMLPFYLLRHPLTLRIFCEVTNPKRERVVGLEAMPGSLTTLFERYLSQVASRVTELSSRDQRYYPADVLVALNQIGYALWNSKDRIIEQNELRQLLRDDNRPWDKSIVYALEQGGILIRTPIHERVSIGYAISYDALAGHIVADALIKQLQTEGRTLANWLADEQTVTALSGEIGERFTLATDTFRALVGVVPHRLHGQQLWLLLNGELQAEALNEAVKLDPAYLNRETVEKLAELARQMPSTVSHNRDIFYRLWETRAAPHPLNSEFLDAVLRPMTMAERDVRWSEWIRRNQQGFRNERGVVADILRWKQQWQSATAITSQDALRARWFMWTLTSTVRDLRDHATHALYWFGNRDPRALFELTLDSLAINDPYVPERMLAVCYGVAMGLWAHPDGGVLRETIIPFASELIDNIFVPNAPYPTWHVLMRDYALGTITLACRIDPSWLTDDRATYLEPPFGHMPTPFTDASQIDETQVVPAKSAIRMDFGNYTIGRLIKGRHNYDYNHPLYKDVVKQIEYRLLELGYSQEKFGDFDKSIEQARWHYRPNRESKTDRYGKKYSWIAYFDMYGIHEACKLLDERHRDERTSDTDIDPSFPEPAKIWIPHINTLFSNETKSPKQWLVHGPTPDYSHLLDELPEVDGQVGPWTLLDGYIREYSAEYDQRIFTFLRCLLIDPAQKERLAAKFYTIQHPGTDAIPRPRGDYYTYGGEIPWSNRFGAPMRDESGRVHRNLQQAFSYWADGDWTGIPVEIPIWDWEWESYHSQLNQVSGITTPSPSICESLRLTNRRGDWDLYDSNGNVATIYREASMVDKSLIANFLYIRSDLLRQYLFDTEQTLLWLLWGERGFEESHFDMVEQLNNDYQAYANIHKQLFLLRPQLRN
jgi:hypothetical protein